MLLTKRKLHQEDCAVRLAIADELGTTIGQRWFNIRLNPAIYLRCCGGPAADVERPVEERAASTYHQENMRNITAAAEQGPARCSATCSASIASSRLDGIWSRTTGFA
jgi:hypothetical protein